MKKNIKIGFIGQGWIGKHYADNFEERGFNVVRYAKEKPYVQNKEKIKGCDIVFIAVPTPTTSKGFDKSIVKIALNLIGEGKTAVIKSTVLPGSTKQLQRANPKIFVMHSPEFLREESAAFDTAHPDRNIIGIPVRSKEFMFKAKEVMKTLPDAPFDLICDSNEAELVKYAGNCFLFTKVVFMNMLHDLSKGLDCEWETVRDAMRGDPRIGHSHMDPVHKSGRGAGGHCFIKDFAAFTNLYEKTLKDTFGTEALRAFEKKNIHLLKSTKKDLDLLQGVYGDIIKE